MKTKEELIKEETERQEMERKEALENAKKDAEEQRKQAEDARQKAAKAEGMVEAMRTFQNAQANNGNTQWTKEQWAEFEEKTGFTQAGITAIDSALGTKIRDVETKFEERARKAEERAKAAEDKFNSYEGKRSLDNQTREYLNKKPQYARYEKDFNEFINDYPEEMRKDPAKLSKLFDKAEIYIKGKVGEKEMRKSVGGSTRFGSDEGGNNDDIPAVDLSELRSHERLTVERILPTKEREEMLKANRHDLKGESGVMINSKSEWDKYKK